jgi:hypothetical protein
LKEEEGRSLATEEGFECFVRQQNLQLNKLQVDFAFAFVRVNILIFVRWLGWSKVRGEGPRLMPAASSVYFTPNVRSIL